VTAQWEQVLSQSLPCGLAGQAGGITAASAPSQSTWQDKRPVEQEHRMDADPPIPAAEPWFPTQSRPQVLPAVQAFPP
jgi:hypothetical protein